MPGVFSSGEFWFGAVILCVYQIGKFIELGPFDARYSKLSQFPNLKATDFAGPSSFAGALFLFVAITLMIYVALCLVSPSLIAGWIRVTTPTPSAEAIASQVASVPYPLYIAATFMGLAQQAIPGTSRFANVYRDVFHYLMGVPKNAVDMAENASARIEERLGSDKGMLVEELRLFASPAWRRKIETFADIGFYRSEIERMKLDDDDAIDQMRDDSAREIKNVIERLIYAAAIASLRKSGAKGLDELGKALGAPRRIDPNPYVYLQVSVLCCIFGALVLSFLIPMASPMIQSLGWGAGYWPPEVGSSKVYILAQVVPVFIAVFLTVIYTKAGLLPIQAGKTSLSHVFRTYSGFLFLILIFVTVYDFLQSFADYGANSQNYSGTLFSFISTWMPYHVLHAFISLSVCLVVIRHYVAESEPRGRGALVRTWTLLLVVAGGISAFYAAARLRFQFGEFAPDYFVLIVLLNLAAASIAFFATLFVCRSQVRPA